MAAEWDYGWTTQAASNLGQKMSGIQSAVQQVTQGLLDIIDAKIAAGSVAVSTGSNQLLSQFALPYANSQSVIQQTTQSIQQQLAGKSSAISEAIGAYPVQSGLAPSGYGSGSAQVSPALPEQSGSIPSYPAGQAGPVSGVLPTPVGGMAYPGTSNVPPSASTPATNLGGLVPPGFYPMVDFTTKQYTLASTDTRQPPQEADAGFVFVWNCVLNQWDNIPLSDLQTFTHVDLVQLPCMQQQPGAGQVAPVPLPAVPVLPPPALPPAGVLPPGIMLPPQIPPIGGGPPQPIPLIIPPAPAPLPVPQPIIPTPAPAPQPPQPIVYPATQTVAQYPIDPTTNQPFPPGHYDLCECLEKNIRALCDCLVAITQMICQCMQKGAQPVSDPMFDIASGRYDDEDNTISGFFGGAAANIVGSTNQQDAVDKIVSDMKIWGL